MKADEFVMEVRLLMEEEGRERQRVFERYQLAAGELREIDDRLEALQKTIDVYSLRHGLTAASPVIESMRARFADMTTRDALVTIARENRGVLAAAEAGRLLVRAGFFKDKASAAGTIYPTLRRESESFEKIKPGFYRLIEHQNGADGDSPEVPAFLRRPISAPEGPMP